MTQQHSQGGTAGGHPRRPPAHRSVSLLHSPGKRKFGEESTLSHASSNIPSSDRANPPSPGSSKPRVKKDSSGEVSDAGQWFDKSNKNVSQNSASFVDNDPPFFLRNSSSSTSPDDPNGRYLHPQTIPHRPNILRANTGGSSDDFRSVIDDLTVENKKLKKRLKKYEKMHDAHLQDDRLFEIRMHGLPPHKKRELEETLKKFAMALEEAPDRPAEPSEPALPQYSKRPRLRQEKTLSSYASTNFADSAYISMSGRNSNTHSGNPTSNAASAQNSNATHVTQNERPKQQEQQQPYSRHEESIHSYLQDIPEGLMPKTVAMTENAKKRLVVKRMERIFAGKGPAVGGHQQPIQQQEVAQSAARDDRVAQEQATGRQSRKEGVREARIMSGRGDKMPPTDESDEAEALQHVNPEAKVEEQDFASHQSPGHDSPDQRPTRPLDLDPHRAQVPVDNMNYIRHLGFSPPDGDLAQQPEEGHGWIYLNLLINMAQLHTINVTTEFVKKSLLEYSSKFELSSDGRKVRWKGGNDVSLDSSDSSPDHEGMELASRRMKRMGKKRQKLGSGSTEHSSEMTGQSSDMNTRRSKKSNGFAYTPLFYHKESSDSYDASNADGTDEYASPWPAHATGASSGPASSGNRTSARKQKNDDGPIIFYSKAKFCTDLSGDRGVLNHDHIDHPSYEKLTEMPLGGPDEMCFEMFSDGDARQRPLTETPDSPDAMDVDSSSPQDIKLDLSDMPVRADAKGIPQWIDFEVSGLGGILPDDNFTVEVVRRQVPVSAPESTPGAVHARAKAYPNRLSSILNGQEARMTKSLTPAIDQAIVSAHHKSLPPSELPPPSMMPYDPNGDDDDSDTASNTSTTEDEHSGAVSSTLPQAAPRLIDLDTASQETETGGSEEDDEASPIDEDDASVDFLEAARKIDPEAIRIQERDYDASVAERLAEDIPAGSSAATAGGGSGFNSPISGAHGSVQSLKRARTSDSLLVNGKAPRCE
ncbi:uncharacterized protein K452DRAFT_240392 [Aplosporella prunicola CBS 121167]|uniref:Frequency clock protein n=1 Tax=Aplosporella prunicola CBS 121167 TaxID=1176127 RepID=A0A6A6BSS5_9PEZI|nr:uncharacterized protein K452DRAFT_240392 [Aplosporella prunicola CBS 121167]KAF2147169.1 hypothetical protein K452DRAFT_240392 [Aplosporella prunicola CBS 121167]